MGINYKTPHLVVSNAKRKDYMKKDWKMSLHKFFHFMTQQYEIYSCNDDYGIVFYKCKICGHLKEVPFNELPLL